ncbi:hypothetical protein CN947_13435 [Bacillus cereus]|nr:hypothetical protein CN947_13435 [Bacillus cereus]
MEKRCIIIAKQVLQFLKPKAIELGTPIVEKLLEEGAKSIGDSIGDLLKKKKRDEIYTVIKDTLLNEPYKYSRAELKKYIGLATHIRRLLVEDSGGYKVYIPVYGQVKEILESAEINKWWKLINSIKSHIRERDYEELLGVYRTQNFDNKYFLQYPEIIDEFKRLIEQNDLSEIVQFLGSYSPLWHNQFDSTTRELHKNKIKGEEAGKRLRKCWTDWNDREIRKLENIKKGIDI